MPKKPNPQTLKHCALVELSLNCEWICYGFKKGSKELAKYIHEEGFIQIKGPFVDWPNSLLEELANVIYSTRSGQKHLLHLVIQPHMSNFSLKLHGSTHSAMTMLETRCTESLKCLEFTHNNNLPPQYFSNFLGCFKNLTKLNVYASMVDDCSFIAIGENCSKLVELNAGSTWMTNNGLKGMSMDEVMVPFGSLYRLPNLRLIDVSETRVTPEGLSLFLVCHPDLVKLDHKENFHSFRLAKTQYSCNSQQFSLKSLSSIDMYLSPDDFEFALDHCPLVESVTITSAGLANEDLYKLMTVKNLTQLHLGNKNSLNFNFYEGVAPILNEVGGNLKKLVLEDFHEVDVDYIGEKCPIVEHLALSGITAYAPVGNNFKPHFFTKLASLELWNKIGLDHELAVSGNVLIQLLYRAPLSYLLLQRIATLTDDLFALVLSLNPLLTLRNVVIDYCHNISGKVFWQLLEQPNNLSVMRCWHNKNTSEADKNAIKAVIKEENLQLYWEWYPYNEYEELLDAGQIQLSDEEADSDDDDVG